MKVLLYEYDCNKCEHSFISPGISGELYGEFLMWSECKGEVAYLNAVSDPVFLEVEKIFDGVVKRRNIKKFDDPELFQFVFSDTCDRARDGSPFRIGLNPICPECGSRDMRSWGALQPHKYTEQDIEYISHTEWGRLSLPEKKERIERSIHEFLYHRNIS